MDLTKSIDGLYMECGYINVVQFLLNFKPWLYLYALCYTCFNLHKKGIVLNMNMIITILVGILSTSIMKYSKNTIIMGLTMLRMYFLKIVSKRRERK